MITTDQIRRLRAFLLAGIVAMVLGAVTGAGFFIVGGIFGPISDSASMLIAFTLIPVAVGLDQLFGRNDERRSRIARNIGLTGLGFFALGGFGLVLHAIVFQWIPAGVMLGVQFFGILLQGIWLIMIGNLTYRSGIFSRQSGIAAIISGSGYVLFVVGSPFGSNAPISLIGGMVGLIAFLVWASKARSQLKIKT
jgi:hypothetical protein